ncbi:MAG: DUF2569 domain-containing protein [Terracidiphilus sp.]|jgi:hypothetical protein
MTISCATCSTALDEGVQICPNCGTAVAAQPGVAEIGATETPACKPANDLKGFGGWLILPAVALAVSPIARLLRIIFNVQTLIARERLGIFENHPSLNDLYIYEVVVDAAFIAAAICLNFLFYKEKRILPKCMIAFYAAQCFFAWADFLAITAIVPPRHPFSLLLGVVEVFVVAAVWIPYFHSSIRVKRTFVN